MNMTTRYANWIGIYLVAWSALAQYSVVRADESSEDQNLLNRLKQAGGGSGGFRLDCHALKAQVTQNKRLVIRITLENKSEVAASVAVPVGTKGIGCYIFFRGQERVPLSDFGKAYLGSELSYITPTFRPGQTDERELEIDRLFEMKRPGKYSVFANCRTATSEVGELIAKPVEIELLAPQ